MECRIANSERWSTHHSRFAIRYSEFAIRNSHFKGAGCHCSLSSALPSAVMGSPHCWNSSGTLPVMFRWKGIGRKTTPREAI